MPSNPHETKVINDCETRIRKLLGKHGTNINKAASLDAIKSIIKTIDSETQKKALGAYNKIIEQSLESMSKEDLAAHKTKDSKEIWKMDVDFQTVMILEWMELPTTEQWKFPWHLAEIGEEILKQDRATGTISDMGYFARLCKFLQAVEDSSSNLAAAGAESEGVNIDATFTNEMAKLHIDDKSIAGEAPDHAQV